MQRIDDATAVATLPAVPTTPGAPGFFTEGAPGTLAPTKVRGWWLNLVQESLCSPVQAAGIALDKTKTNLLWESMLAAGYFVDGGGVNGLVINPPVALTTLAVGVRFCVKVAVTSTGAATLNVSGLGGVPITRYGGRALLPGDLVAGGIAMLEFDGTVFQLISGGLRQGSNTAYYTAAGTSSFTVPAGVFAIFARIWGGGAGGGGANFSNYGNGGGGGGYTEGWFAVTPGQVITVIVGAGGAAGGTGGQNGSPGGTSSLGSLASATGGQGAAGNQSGATSGSVALGGQGYGGTFSLPGCNGGCPIGNWVAATAGGFGGGSFGSQGGIAQQGQQGQSGAGPGAGGAGGTANGNTSANTGGNGQPGTVLISW